jgi:16S rRNA (cytosine1402-N4)-methyltransferase
MYHEPVLLKETIDALNIAPSGVYVDATFGGGGHSREILSRLGDGRVYAFDQDPDAAGNAPSDSRFTLITENFRYLRNFLKLHHVVTIDGLMADLGVSSHQIDEPSRGFSFRHEGPLDMRMDKTQELDASQVVNTYPQEELIRILRDYGEVPRPQVVARALMNRRDFNPVATTLELRDALLPLAPRGKENQFLAKVFQSLRIEVNDELAALGMLLTQATQLLVPGGRMAVITYQSLEDRMVKNYFRAGNFQGRLEKDLYGNTISPIEPVKVAREVPGHDETEKNPRARTARLRVARRRTDEHGK